MSSRRLGLDGPGGPTNLWASPNREEITLPGKHHIQKDAPHEPGGAVAGRPARLNP